MAEIGTSPLTPVFGVEVKGVDVMDITAGNLFPEIRELFEEHSALLFRGQQMSPEKHLEIADLFGPIEDRRADERRKGEAFEIPEVSNLREDGSTTPEMDMHTLNLKANFLWHADSTFLPDPALINIITAHVVPSSGGATELASTRAAWREMPEELKSRISGRGVWHHLSISRARISAELAKDPMFHKWPAQHWNSVWRNPANGLESLYIASHAYRVDGYDDAESRALLDELTEFCTQPRFVYSHNWRVGDVMIWDQRCVMHRGTPWPYDEPRRLTSLCATAREGDGLDSIRVA